MIQEDELSLPGALIGVKAAELPEEPAVPLGGEPKFLAELVQV